MTEVEICGGGHRTWLRDCLLCLWVPPPHVYKGGREEEAGQEEVRPRGGVLLQVGFAPPPLSYYYKEKGGKRRGREGKGGRPPTLTQFGLGLGGARLHLAAASSLPLGPMKAH